MTLSIGTDRRGPLDTVYVGTRDARYGVVVVGDGMRLAWPQQLKSPLEPTTYFEWGSITPGALGLSYALLLSATRGNRDCATDLFSRFLRLVVSRWDREWFVTTRCQILRWIGEQPGHLEGRESAAEGGVT